MNTDEDSGEANEPPEEPPGSECGAKKSKREENEDLQCVRNYQAHDPAHLAKSRPDSANSEPATEPAAQAAFRKTELLDKLPLLRSEVPVVWQKSPDRQADEIHDRIDIPEERFGLVIDCLKTPGLQTRRGARILMPRRPAVVTPRIPLFLILPVLRRELKRAGEELVRIVVRKVKGHSYDISVHTRGIEHSLQTVQRAGAPNRKGVRG